MFARKGINFEGFEFLENLSKIKGIKQKVRGQAKITPIPHNVPRLETGDIFDVDKAKKPIAVVKDVKKVGKIFSFKE